MAASLENNPSDCALAIAIPLTWADFKRDLEAGDHKDFARNWASQFPGGSAEFAWSHYERFANLVLDVAQFAEKAGVMVTYRAQLADWGGLLKERAIVTLLTHCKKTPGAPEEDRIEFFDQLHSVDELTGAALSGYAGIFDLTICFSLALAARFKKKFPASTVIANKGPARLDYRLAIYRQVLRLLQTGQYAYEDAMIEVQTAVLKAASTS